MAFLRKLLHGIFEVTNYAGVDCIHVGRSDIFLNTAVYFFRFGNILVDTAAVNQWPKVRRYLRQHPEVSTVCVTHHHEDHSGNCWNIQHGNWKQRASTNTMSSENAAASNADEPHSHLPTIYAPALSAHLLQSGFHLEWYRKFIWGRSHASRQLMVHAYPQDAFTVPFQLCEADKQRLLHTHGLAMDDRQLDASRHGLQPIHTHEVHEHEHHHKSASHHGAAPWVITSHPHHSQHQRSVTDMTAYEQLISKKQIEIQCIPTPGHSFDHSCIYFPEFQFLFTADALVTPKPRVARFDEDVLQGMASLERLVQLPISLVFCAHKGPVPNGRALLLQRLQWLQHLRRRCIVLWAGGEDDIRTIAQKLLGREPFLHYATHGDFGAENLVRGLLADKLHSRG